MRSRQRGLFAIAALIGIAIGGITIAAPDRVALTWMIPVGVILCALGVLAWYRGVRSSAAGPRMDPSDSAWLDVDGPNNPTDIVLLMTFDESPTFEAVKATVAQRLLRFDRFRQRVVETGSHPHWEPDDAFKIENHVLRYDVNEALTAARLAAAVAELGSGNMDPERPLWSLHVVKGTDGSGALVLRVHHCLADGFALAHAVAFPKRSADEPNTAPRMPSRPSSPVMRAAELASSMGQMLRSPFGNQIVFRGEVTGRRRMAWSSGFSLATAKGVARSHDCTLNELLTTALSGALRRLLAERGELGQGRSVRAVVPANLRPVRWVEDVEDSLGNRFGFFFIDLPVEEQTVDMRLRVLKSRMRASNRLVEAAAAFGLLKPLARSGGALERPLSDFFARKVSVIVSNVPGPRAPVHFGEQQVREVMFWEPHPGKLGMAVSILTYAGTIRMGVRTDEGVAVEPERLVGLFEAELAVILEGACEGSEMLRAAL